MPRHGVIRIRDPQQLLFAVFLMALGALGIVFGWDLPMGEAVRMGAGYLPKVLCGILLVMGGGLAIAAFAFDGPPLERWAWRPFVLILGSLCLFGVLVEDLGLIVTSIGTVLLATLAAPDRRWREAAIFAVGLAVFCAVVFRVLLGLPLPVLPS